MMNVKETPYNQVIGLPLICGGVMNVSVGEMKHGVSLCMVETSLSKFCLINVPSSIFIDWYQPRERSKVSHHCKDLNETFTISKSGTIKLSWGDQDPEVICGLRVDTLEQLAMHFRSAVVSYNKQQKKINLAKEAFARIPVYHNNIITI